GHRHQPDLIDSGDGASALVVYRDGTDQRAPPAFAAPGLNVRKTSRTAAVQVADTTDLHRQVEGSAPGSIRHRHRHPLNGGVQRGRVKAESAFDLRGLDQRDQRLALGIADLPDTSETRTEIKA